MLHRWMLLQTQGFTLKNMTRSTFCEIMAFDNGMLVSFENSWVHAFHWNGIYFDMFLPKEIQRF